MNLLLNFILLSVMGLSIWPMTLTQSKRPTKEYTSYRRYPLCSPSDYMRYPKTNADVVSIVREAIARGVTVKALGARHSQTDIICTEGIPIDMSGLNFRKMHSDNVRVTFGAGITLWEAGEFLLQNGRAFRITPAYGGITLGGAIGTGAHGSTIKYNATISSQVVKMTVVDGRGRIVEITDPTDLKAFKVNLGLLGVVVDITLDTVPLYNVLAHNYVTSDDVLTNGVAANWALTADQITIHWFPALNEVVVANLTFVSVNSYGTARTNGIVPTTYDNFNLIGTRVKEIAMGLASSECAVASTLGYTILHVIEFYLELGLFAQAPDFVPIYTENGLLVENPATGYAHRMFSAVCSEVSSGLLGEGCAWAHGHLNANVTILDNEFNLALSDLGDFVKAVKDISKKTPTAFLLQGLFMRFSGKSDHYMSTSYGRHSVHIEFYLWKRNDPYNDATASLAGYQTILQTLAKRFKARAHWGKCGLVYHGSKMLDVKLDKNARKSFVDAMKRFDPAQIFLNNFGRRILKSGNTIDIDPLTTRCALLDNCFCSLDSDCAEGQICTTLPGYDSYFVCQSKNVVSELKIDKNLLPPPLGIVDYLVKTVPTLVTSVLSQCTVPEVIDTVASSIIKPLLG